MDLASLQSDCEHTHGSQMEVSKAGSGLGRGVRRGDSYPTRVSGKACRDKHSRPEERKGHGPEVGVSD